MPQQRRKVPFSGKKKKTQIMQKRQVKGTQKFCKSISDSYDDGETTEDNTEITARKLMEQPHSTSRGGASSSSGTESTRGRNFNRYNLQFYQESKRQLEQMKLEAYKPLQHVTYKEREIDSCYFKDYDFPIRPEWNYDMSKETLERNENRYFREYVDQLQKLHQEKNKDLSIFELNLETWRQLWRVLEFSDILLIIVDIRYATLMFPPALYKYITKTLKKHAILVLNKVDLVSAESVLAWRQYFADTYPGLPIVLFASYITRNAQGGVGRKRKGYKRSMESVLNIYRECQKIVQKGKVDLSAWEQKILEDMKIENVCFDDVDDIPAAEVEEECNENNVPHPSQNKETHSAYQDGILTIGCIGFPNVGKSSLINALKGKKVVSVSRTPGHTKHFQTIFLTREVRLCDCPGLVFPSSTPKYLQVLLGSYPISQLQVPYRSLKFLAEHLNLPQLLKLRLPEDFDEWSAAAVSDAWALKRGFLTAKAARPDRYRAANHLLRMSLAGQLGIILQFYPPGFEEQKEVWSKHSELPEIRKYQNITDDVNSIETPGDTSSLNSDSGETDEESSSDDETNIEEDDAAVKQTNSNTFALLLEDE